MKKEQSQEVCLVEKVLGYYIQPHRMCTTQLLETQFITDYI